ncbi:mitochondrial ribosomal protein subunit L20-domain-containing protein [Jimgerdemannia flammicorona]|uniref:Mitochondrial ribosomal protein subunit L20-domain-containing protein n=1 Tax=Jimgerdemannia flammicorona TaxID=994334 RepID=A0A433QIJ7_9FUNG|nr:mitochondrial ribosomal protein subunit L20-domain-containing protein [Jimgerdemannia flammicorona]
MLRVLQLPRPSLIPLTRQATVAAANRKPKMASVPTTETPLSDGSTLITRHPLSTPKSSLKAPLLHPRVAYKQLTDAEIEEMRALRLSDPQTWSISKLAAKFGCSTFFVGMKARLAGGQNEVKEEEVREEGRVERRKRFTRENRRRRRELW